MSETISVTIPHETVNDESVRLLGWYLDSGSYVEKEQLICEVETSKAIMEIHAPEAGILQYRFAVGDEVPVGSIICQIVPAGAREAVQTVIATKTEMSAVSDGTHAVTADLAVARFTPLARKMAAEYGIDQAVFPAGTLVRSADVLVQAGRSIPQTQSRTERFAFRKTVTAKQVNLPDNPPVTGASVDWTDLPRKKIVESRILGTGQAASIQSSVTMICRAPNLRARMDRLASPAVGVTALVVFEVARVLRKFPMFNAVHNQGRMGQYREVNVGWAIDGGEGLVVPVIKDADQKTLREISSSMERHIEDYIGNTLDHSLFTGGTFTVSDLSSVGVSYFQPLISQGQSAILGIGSELPAGSGGSSLYLTLAFDHQLTEGRKAAQLLRDLTRRLEAHSELEPTAKQNGDHSSEHESFCVLCRRNASTLSLHNAILIKSEVPAGLVCSNCLWGTR